MLRRFAAYKFKNKYLFDRQLFNENKSSKSVFVVTAYTIVFFWPAIPHFPLTNI